MPFQCLSEEVAAAPIPIEITATQRVLSACVGVLATNLVATPLDVVKTRVQAAQAETVGKEFTAGRSSIYGPPLEPCEKCRQQCRLYTTSARASATSAASAAIGTATSAANTALDVNPNAPRVMNPARPPPPLPPGTIDALFHIAHREGPRGLYRGLDVALLMAVPATVLYYAVYDDMLARLEAGGAGKVMAPITSGASARILATVCMAPLELVRTRVQSERASTAVEAATGPARVGLRGLGGLPTVSVGRAVVAVVREEGVLALWRGVGTTMWRDVPFSMIYWLGYENLKDRLGCKWVPAEGSRGVPREQGSTTSRARGEPGNQRGSADFLLRSFVAGAVSGVVASLLTHPFDVVKTQQQILIKDSRVGGCEHRPPPPRRHPGTFEVMRGIVNSQGVRGLFTGAFARVGKVAPACGIMIFSYEAGKRFFSRRNAEAAAARASPTKARGQR